MPTPPDHQPHGNQAGQRDPSARHVVLLSAGATDSKTARGSMAKLVMRRVTAANGLEQQIFCRNTAASKGLRGVMPGHSLRCA